MPILDSRNSAAAQPYCAIDVHRHDPALAPLELELRLLCRDETQREVENEMQREMQPDCTTEVH